MLEMPNTSRLAVIIATHTRIFVLLLLRKTIHNAPLRKPPSAAVIVINGRKGPVGLSINPITSCSEKTIAPYIGPNKIAGIIVKMLDISILIPFSPNNGMKKENAVLVISAMLRNTAETVILRMYNDDLSNKPPSQNEFLCKCKLLYISF